MDKDLKYNRWVFTLNANDLEYLPTEALLTDCLNDISKEWGYQLELQTRYHYQGWFVCDIRQRQPTVLKVFEEWFAENDKLFEIKFLTIDRMRGTVEQCIAYCSKSETKFGEYHTNRYRYSQSDIVMLQQKSTRYPWQQTFIERFFTEDEKKLIEPDDRTIHVLYDSSGKSGKSKLVKYLCVTYKDVIKISFGSASQLRSAVATAGPYKMYIIDIPRTLGADDSMSSLFSTIEDIKNGFVVSSMYGKMERLVMEPPHIIVMTNKEIKSDMLSDDRWVTWFFSKDKTVNILKYDYATGSMQHA